MSYKFNLFDVHFYFQFVHLFFGGEGGYHNYSFSLATKKKTLKTFSTIVLQFSYF